MSITAIAAIVSTIIGPITNLLSEAIPDKDKRDELAHKLATMAASQAHENSLAQLKVNEKEAESAHMFVAGWRPYIGWTCGFAMGFNYIVVPILTGMDVHLQVLDITTMFPVLLGMLGLAGLRTTEKVKGVSREDLKT